MNYCNQCGAKLDWLIPEGDQRHRYVCTHCSTIHYENPKIIAGALVEHGNNILLCRRAIHPGYGLWTLPAGFMENGESLAEAAARETREEACAHITIGKLFSAVSLPYHNQVHLFHLATLSTPGIAPGVESLETVWFAEADIPWADIAFRTVRWTLQRYFEDRARGQFACHHFTFEQPAQPNEK